MCIETFAKESSMCRLPVLANDNGASSKILKDNLFSAVKAEALRLKCAVAVVDGSLVLLLT